VCVLLVSTFIGVTSGIVRRNACLFLNAHPTLAAEGPLVGNRPGDDRSGPAERAEIGSRGTNGIVSVLHMPRPKFFTRRAFKYSFVAFGSRHGRVKARLDGKCAPAWLRIALKPWCFGHVPCSYESTMFPVCVGTLRSSLTACWKWTRAVLIRSVRIDEANEFVASVYWDRVRWAF